ncbi:hypothetical protein NLJ89_g9192 [Agrocybe chaxingu]|uniref:Uncharacterized protein n=1 Tax=Agrocybe chaxingu TaxID=84603 RepID=A0A9W8JTZ9_9AGAR|nr:hypothetical protein NLJ89_g9192 [Agrocybe chaxingu]
MSPTKVYLITGTNRGIGLGLVNEIVTRHEDAVVYAGVRDPAKATALQETSTKFPGKVEIVKLISADEQTHKDVAKMIQEKHGYVDVVIANAAVSDARGAVGMLQIDALRKHFEVNATGVIVLFQAVLPLLEASKSTPKFIPISSGGGSLTAFIDQRFEVTAYGASKAALNYITRRIHFENDWLVAFPLSPGVVKTDAVYQARDLDKTGEIAKLLDQASVSIEDASVMLVNIVDNATREKEGGEFVDVDGGRIPW